MEFNLLTISNYGWKGFCLFSFENENNIYPLLCVDYQNDRIIFAFLFRFKIMINL